MKAFLFDIYYQTIDNSPEIRLFLIKENGDSIILKDRDFRPYFYIQTKDLHQIKGIKKQFPEITSVDKINKKILGKDSQFYKLTVNHPKDVPILREKFKGLDFVDNIFEHDILFYRRYLMDKGIYPTGWVDVELNEDEPLFISNIRAIQGEIPELKILSFDTEIYNPKGMPRSKKDPIIMVSLASNTGLNKVLTWKSCKNIPDYVEVLEDEKAILHRLGEIINESDYDIILGYNTDNFDFPYLLDRLKINNLELPLGRDDSEFRIMGSKTMPETRIPGRANIDLYPIARRNVKLSSYVLEDVVKDVLGIKKEKIPVDLMWKYWDEGGEKLNDYFNYSMEDAQVALSLGENFLPLYIELSRITGQTLHDVSRMTTGQLVEWLLMREATSGGEIIPNRPGGEEYRSRAAVSYTGGYVKQPKKGISENIAVYDFRSLYPSVIVTHNIDPSTIRTEGCHGDVVPNMEICFDKDVPGFIPQILKGLIENRSNVKKAMKESTNELDRKMLKYKQNALKILANSFYGYMGYPRARWYKQECAQGVAALARMYIKKVMELAEKEFGFEVIYGDTDSLFIVVPPEKKEDSSRFLKAANKTLPGIIELEYEGFFERGIFVTKKRYALIDENDKITVKGLELVRRDWSTITKQTQKDVLQILLKENSPEKAAKVVREVIERIKKRNVELEDLVIYTQLTKKISSYKNIGPHLIAAKKLHERGVEINPGMIIGYIIKKGNKMVSMRAEPIEYVTIDEYDPSYYIDNQILPAVLRIFEAIGYSRDYLREGIQQQSMDKWF